MFLGYQINEQGKEFIASVRNSKEELENNQFVKYTRIEESNEDWQLVDGAWRIGGYTIEEQNEAIRATRESLYVQTSDKLKADYDEAVARGADNVEELKKLWLASKDEIRANNPYIGGDKDGLQGQKTEVRTYSYE